MLELIYDRTSSDVQYAKNLVNQVKLKGFSSLTEELKELYEKGLKGCYSTPDLNRVENAVQYVSDLLNSLNYKNEVNTKSWEFGEIFTPEHVERYLRNIRNIRSAISIPSTIPEVPLSYKPYTNANIIEKIIYELSNIVAYLTQRFVYSGVANLGQDRNWQQRFRTGRTWASQNYMLSQYTDEDTVATISSQGDENEVQVTNNLGLSDVTIFDNPYDTIKSLNHSMEILDTLIGGDE